ncbi:MAG: DUF3465 domain-containing protein [Neisseriaceae bacterium]|nr:DUF3465 domain-containing protein [Neisseriaceae bacterium]
MKNFIIIILLCALIGSWVYFLLNKSNQHTETTQTTQIQTQNITQQNTKPSVDKNTNQAIETPVSNNGLQLIQQAFNHQQRDVLVESSGIVKTLLKDDTEGSQHQRFILQLPNNMTVLVAHNIDLAPRILDLQVGDTVEFKGDYMYNSKGGSIHWTHKDPRGNHPDGYLKHKGNIYQ